MKMIYLIRHGKTEANLAHLYCGSTDLPLSEQGREELRHLQYEVPAEAVFCTSGMKRTEQTLSCLFGSVPHETEPGLREVDFGAFEMKSYDELRENPDYQNWITGDNFRNVPPGGESGEQMTKRVLETFRQLLEQDKPVIAVTHGGVIAAILASLFPEENKNLYQWQPEPGHGYAVSDTEWKKIP